MKTAEEFLKEKGIKDTLYDVKNPEPNNWIKGGLSALLDEYRNQSHSTTLPSDEEIDEIAFRRLLLTNRDANTELQDRMLIIDGLKIMRSLCEAKLAEMEREKPSLQDRLFTLANDFAVAKHGDIAVRLHSIHNSITTTT